MIKYFFLVLYGLAYAQSAMGKDLEFPAPKDAVLSLVGRDMELNGVTLSAWDLRSDAEPASVLKFYKDLWATGGPTGGQAYAEQKLGSWQILTHVEGELVYTAQIQLAESKKGSEGLLGISDVLKRKPTEAKKLASDFPKPAGSVVQNDLVAQDQGVRSRTIVMKSPSSVQQNLDFYVRWFDQNGWIIEDGLRMTEKNQGAVVATRQGDRWQLTFTPSDNATAMVAVLEER